MVCACHLFCLFHVFPGVTRLADISLHNPVSISVPDESFCQFDLEDREILEDYDLQSSDELDGFAIPEGLEQYVALVPSKLRLVSLAAFILQKCQVGLGARPGSTEGREGCRLDQALATTS